MDCNLNQVLDIYGSRFELRMIVPTKNINESKWDSVIYSQYGPNHQSCSYAYVYMYTPGGTLSTFDFRKLRMIGVPVTGPTYTYDDIMSVIHNTQRPESIL